MSQMRQEKLAYTVEETAELLSISRAHIYRLLDRNELESIVIGRSRRVTLEQLKRFLCELEKSGARKHGEILDYSESFNSF